MKTILVPTDFSDGAFNALEHALHYAKSLNYSVKIVHAYSMPPTGSAVMVDITEILEKNANEELALLKKRVEALEFSDGTSISYHAVHGSVVHVINRTSEEEGIEFVIMGTQGASGITEKWLGTNAADAAKYVKDPLLIIPAKQKFKPLKDLLLATDLKIMENERQLGFLANFCFKNKCQVNFVHVRLEGDKLQDDTVMAYQNQLDSIFDENIPRIDFINADDIHDGIHQGIVRYKPDVLAVVRHEYGFFKGLFKSSVSRELIAESELPVLVLQDK